MRGLSSMCNAPTRVLLVSGVDATPVLEPAEHVLDLVAFFL